MRFILKYRGSPEKARRLVQLYPGIRLVETRAGCFIVEGLDALVRGFASVHGWEVSLQSPPKPRSK